MKHNFTHLLVLGLLCFCANGFGQKIKDQYFRLNRNEADQLYRGLKIKPDSSFFHTPISKETAVYQTGHYLRITPKGESAEVSLYSTTPFQLHLLNLRTPLSFVVRDNEGQTLDSVEVFMDQRALKYDPKMHCFKGNHAPKHSILEVRTPGHSAYFELTRNRKNGFPLIRPYHRFAASRIGHWITLPLRIATSPIVFVTRGIRRHRWYFPWRRWFPQPREKSLEGYIALNQPKYRLGDTLRLKAYVSSPKGRPLRRDLDLTIHSYGKKGSFKQKISAKSPGSYHLNWPLGDSLEIDKRYSIYLEHPQKAKMEGLSYSFKIEDYTLDEVVYQVNPFPYSFSYGEKCFIHLNARTTNHLPVPDAQAELFLLSSAPNRFYADQVYVPDTLWHGKENLGVEGKSIVRIPDSLLPAVSMNLELHVYFNNSAGELSEQKLHVDYDYVPREVSYYKGPSIPSADGFRSADSISIELYNAGKQAIWFQIKKENLLVAEGYTQDSLWSWKKEDRSTHVYYLTYRYMLDNEMHTRSSNYRHHFNVLHLEVEGPSQVFPGQEVNYAINVKRGDNRPARGVDLSAGATNAQFDAGDSFSHPNVGYKKRSIRPAPSRYNHQEPKHNYNLHLSRYMVQALGLQDSLYYQYRHTQKLLSVWRDSSLQQDTFYHNIAQFAPFLVKGGKMSPIYLIYANRKLVYYYDSKGQRPYSFAAPEGYNQVVIRSFDHEYTLDSIYLRRGEKLELVINEDYWEKSRYNRLIQRTLQPVAFTAAEAKILERNIFVIRQLRSIDSIFIWDYPDNIYELNARSGVNHKVGPFNYGATLNYVHMNYFDKRLRFEPGFTYDVEKERERLYQHQLALPRELPFNLPHPMLRQYLIRPQSVRLFSPLRLIINFTPAPNFGAKRTGNYQFEYSNKADLPDSVKLLALVLQDSLSGEQWILKPDIRILPNLRPGQYKFFLFNQQKGVYAKNIRIQRDTLLFERLNKVKFKADDGSFVNMLKENQSTMLLWRPPLNTNKAIYEGQTQLISGKVTDKNGEALIGVSILVKGTALGTVSDLDGNYSLEAPLNATELVLSYTGFTTQEYALEGENKIDFTLEESNLLLSEVVVTGYGSTIRGEGRVSGVTAPLHDLSPASGYVRESSVSNFQHHGTSLDVLKALDDNSIRSHFRDYAYWKPNLRSNRDGKVFFSVKFPDDITNWRSFVIAADKKLQAGIYQSNIQAYKPIMAQLNLPRFLVQGDQTTLIGRVLHYSGDTLAVRTHFQAAGRQVFEKNHVATAGGLVEQIEFRAPQQGDSLQFTYALQTQTGYQDGEQRSIPLKPVGTLESDGVFLVLERDTVLDFRNKTGTVHFRAEPSILSLLLEDIQYLRDYSYGCNEQNASKLLGLLAEKQIRQSLNQAFDGEKIIQELLIRLNKAQNGDGSWGWWAGNGENAWMGNYVLQALLEAKKAGYSSTAIENGLRWLTSIWRTQRGTDRLHSLQTLLLAGQRIDTVGLRDILNLPQARLCDRLLCLSVKQILGFPLSIDSLNQGRYTDVYGGAFWEDKKVSRNFYDWHNNCLINTLMAYQIAKKAGLQNELKRIRTHLLVNRGYVYNGSRSGYGWNNTLEVASVLKTILPDLMAGNTTQDLRLNLSGALNGEVSKAPLQATFDANKPLMLKLNGAGPFFCTAYLQSWNRNPQPKSDLFAVKSHLEYHGDKVNQLQFGQPAQLVVEVDVKHEAQYVMLEVPIPAGCSYFSKYQSYRSSEVHREYFADKVSIFCERLSVGQQRFVVELEPRFSGTYTLNPVRIEEMYFPVLYGRNGVEKVSIKP